VPSPATGKTAFVIGLGFMSVIMPCPR
jgi:hypothetical protein